jgi:hypothetical protein
MSDQPQEPMPGQPTDLPLPPAVDRAWGYTGNARYIMAYHSPAGDECTVEDGRSAATGATHAFLMYRRHRAVQPLIADVNLGYSDLDATHCIVLDRQRNRASIAPIDEARQFLHDQHPPREPLTPEQQAAAEAEIERLMQEFRTRPVDAGAVARAMQEQRGRVARMINWLDMAPEPERGRE